MHSQSLFTRHQKRPSQAFVKILDNLLTNISKISEFKLFDDSLANLMRMQIKLKENVKIEEEKRPKYLFDVTLYQEKQRLEALVQQQDQDYDNQMKDYQLSLEKSRDELNKIHTKIVELETKGMLDETTMMVLNNQVHIDMEDEMTELHEELNEMNCCQRLFCCFTPTNILATKRKLDDLQKKRETLLSEEKTENKSKQLDVTLSRLNKKRNEMQAKLAEIENKPPQKANDNLREALYAVRSQIDDKASVHYHALSAETMLQLLCLLDLVEQLERQYKLLILSDTPNMKTPLLQSTVILNAFMQCESDIGEAFKNFYCPDFQCKTAEACYKIYGGLATEERRATMVFPINPTILEKFKSSQQTINMRL
jgi:hypothetical protein